MKGLETSKQKTINDYRQAIHTVSSKNLSSEGTDLTDSERTQQRKIIQCATKALKKLTSALGMKPFEPIQGLNENRSNFVAREFNQARHDHSGFLSVFSFRRNLTVPEIAAMNTATTEILKVVNAFPEKDKKIEMWGIILAHVAFIFFVIIYSLTTS